MLDWSLVSVAVIEIWQPPVLNFLTNKYKVFMFESDRIPDPSLRVLSSTQPVDEYFSLSPSVSVKRLSGSWTAFDSCP